MEKKEKPVKGNKEAHIIKNSDDKPDTCSYPCVDNLLPVEHASIASGADTVHYSPIDQGYLITDNIDHISRKTDQIDSAIDTNKDKSGALIAPSTMDIYDDDATIIVPSENEERTTLTDIIGNNIARAKNKKKRLYITQQKNKYDQNKYNIRPRSSQPIYSLFNTLEKCLGLSPIDANILLDRISIKKTSLIKSILDGYIKSKHINDEAIKCLQSELFGMEYSIDKTTLLKSIDRPPPEWLPFHRAHQLGFVVLKKEEEHVIEIALMDYLDPLRDDWIRKRSGCQQIRKYFVNPSVLKPALRRLKEGQSNEFDNLQQAVIIFEGENQPGGNSAKSDIDARKLIVWHISLAIDRDANDIHFEPIADGGQSRFRIGGQMSNKLIQYDKPHHLELIKSLKLLTSLDPLSVGFRKFGSVNLTIDDRPYGLRASFFPGIHGEKIVVHLLDQSKERFIIANLGLKDHQKKQIDRRIMSSFGMIIVTGPRGSGKTTTHYALLNECQEKKYNVMTFEETVEYHMEGAHQCEIHGASFVDHLETVVYQDVDAVMFTSCNDKKTAEFAMRMAATHLIMVTISANDAASAIIKLLAMGVDPQLFLTTQLLIVSQRMVRTVCPYCVQDISGELVLDNLARRGVDPEMLNDLGIKINANKDYPQSRGCPRCNQSGYTGSRPLFGSLATNPLFHQAILELSSDLDQLYTKLKDIQDATILDHGLELLERHKTTWNEILFRVGRVG